jgi:hypothetical protein
MSTIDDLQSQVHDLQTKALDYVKSVQPTAVDYVAKASRAVADALPTDRPELVSKGIDGALFQAAFAKKVIDAETAFAKAVIDAAVKPFAPAKKRTVKAA